jgi:hypothetical protein
MHAASVCMRACLVRAAGDAVDEGHVAAHAQLVPAGQHGQLQAQRLMAHRAELAAAALARRRRGCCSRARRLRRACACMPSVSSRTDLGTSQKHRGSCSAAHRTCFSSLQAHA